MGRLLSAKDKAFQEERMRLMKEAEKWRKLVITRDGQLYEAEKKSKNWRKRSLTCIHRLKNICV